MARREYKAGTPTTLTGTGLSSTGLSFTIASNTNWPVGTNKFWVTVDPGTAQEERILCTSRSGLTVTITDGDRGQDQTTASAHAVGATIWPSWSATDADEANEHVNAVTNVHGVTGSIAPLASPTFTGTVVLPSTTSIGNVSSTEIGYLDNVTSAIQTQLNTNTPVGSITMWPVSTVPAGWLECNGQSTSGYTALAAVVGATVPDMQGLVPVGFKTSDDAFGTLKGTGGSKTSTAAHTHTLSAHTHVTDINHGHTASGSTSISGGDHAHDVSGSSSGTNTHDHGTGSYTETAAQGIGSDGAPSIAASVLSGAATSAGHSHTASTSVTVDGTGTNNKTSGGPSTDATGASSVSATNGNLQPYFTLKFIIKT
jgi:microcystin-dependent protein